MSTTLQFDEPLKYLEYIDKYFNGELSALDKADFENRCGSDEAFAEEVAFYISARAALKDQLHAQKKKEFHELYTQLSSQQEQPKGIVRKLVPYMAAVAAACLILVLGWQLFVKSPSADQLADNYIQRNMQTLSVTMGKSADSLHAGIDSFNVKNYAEAERIFGSLVNDPVKGPEALENLGIVYLVTGRYDQALLQFEALAAQPQLYANWGPFYQALTLLKRSASGDRVKAKALLEKVIREEMPGKEEAKKWISKI